MATKPSLENLLFLRHPDGWWWWAEGEVEREGSSPKGRDSFYLPDFFLEDPRPWWVPEKIERLPQEEVAQRLAQAAGPISELISPRRQWLEPAFESFEKNFSALLEQIQNGRIEKAVPLVEAESLGEPSLLEKVAWLQRAIRFPSKWLAYGGWDAQEGLLGLTPEILFSQEGGFLATMALAGTAPRNAPSLFESGKDLLEHELVVGDILSVLSKWGMVRRTPTKEWELGALKHLRTDMGMSLTADFAELVQALHPTAALGVRPRSKLSDLRQHLGPGRRRFGAPFGVRLRNGDGLCVVAIRGVQWDQVKLRQASGCGVVRGSQLDREWAELTLKRQVVRDQFGL